MAKSKFIVLKFFEAPIVFLSGPPDRCNRILNGTFPNLNEDIIMPTADGISTIINNSDKESVYILWVRRQSIPLLAHEAIHVASSVLRDRGIEPSNDSSYEETLAYTAQNILRLIEEDKDGE